MRSRAADAVAQAAAIGMEYMATRTISVGRYYLHIGWFDVVGVVAFVAVVELSCSLWKSG